MVQSWSTPETSRVTPIWYMFATRLRWLSFTPLAMPVVPEEKGITAMSVAGSRSTSGAGRPSAMRDAWPASGSSRTITDSAGRPADAAPVIPASPRAFMVSRWDAPACCSCLSISEGMSSEPRVVTVPPARMMPWKATAKARLFGAWSPTTDPFPTPRAASAPAVASTMSCSSP